MWGDRGACPRVAAGEAGACGCPAGSVRLSPGVWGREPFFPAASGSGRQRATSRPPPAAERPAQAPRVPGPSRPRPRLLSRPVRAPTQTPRPPAPRGSPRPAHLAATPRTPGSRGLAWPGTLREARGSGTPLAGREGEGAARLGLRSLPPSAEGTTWRRAGAGPGRGQAAGMGAGPEGAVRPRPAPSWPACPRVVEVFLRGLLFPSSRCVPARRGRDIIVTFESLRTVGINRSPEHHHGMRVR